MHCSGKIGNFPRYFDGRAAVRSTTAVRAKGGINAVEVYALFSMLSSLLLWRFRKRDNHSTLSFIDSICPFVVSYHICFTEMHQPWSMFQFIEIDWRQGAVLQSILITFAIIQSTNFGSKISLGNMIISRTKIIRREFHCRVLSVFLIRLYCISTATLTQEQNPGFSGFLEFEVLA